MSSTNAQEFLTELTPEEALHVFNECLAIHSDMTIKLENEVQPLHAKIDFLADGKVFLKLSIDYKSINYVGLSNVKFFIGTEVYFIKTQLDTVNDALCFDQHTSVLHLKRRKEPRYNIPKHWDQTSTIWSLQTKAKNLARVLDISYHGLKLEIPAMSLNLVKNESIRVQYQLHKRARVVCDGEIKFIATKPNGAAIIGLEVKELGSVHRHKIVSIVDDLINYYAYENLI